MLGRCDKHLNGENTPGGGAKGGIDGYVPQISTDGLFLDGRSVQFIVRSHG